MMLKAGLIVAVSHAYGLGTPGADHAILLPPLLVLLVALMVSEADYMIFTWLAFFGAGP